MVIKKSIAAVAVVVFLAVGYLVGAYIGVPFVDRHQMEGSIGKAKAFNQTNDPDVQAAMELLATDTAVQKRAIASAMVLSSRINQMDELTKQTIDATKDVKGLESVNEGMQKLYVRTQNAKSSYDKFMEESAKVIKGEKSESYEQAANDALLAFTVLENNISACPQFIDAFADYLRENKNDAVDAVAVKWIEYCAEDAVLNNSKSQIEAWKSTYENVAKSDINIGKAHKLGSFPDMKLVVDKMIKVGTPGFKITLGSINRTYSLDNSMRVLSAIVGAEIFFRNNVKLDGRKVLEERMLELTSTNLKLSFSPVMPFIDIAVILAGRPTKEVEAYHY